MMQASKPEDSQHPGARLLGMSTNITVFAAGCAIAALLYARIGVWCFVMPPVLSFATLFLRVVGRAK